MLTYEGLNRMAVIFADGIFMFDFLRGIFVILFEFHRNMISMLMII